MKLTASSERAPPSATTLQDEKTGLLFVPGFRAQGVHTGLKKKRRDVALIVSDHPTSAAAVFTKNAFAAAPVQVSKEHLGKGDVRAIVVNSGNANACTGAQGLKDARSMAHLAAAALDLDPHQVLVASTGIIGRVLDMEKVRTGIDACAKTLDAADGSEVIEAIMTTDSFPKVATRTVQASGRTFRVAGIAKGAGMIHPNMATMLGFIVTDAPIEQGDLQIMLQSVVDETFNMISVDGDESTNDTVFCLANGAAGGEPVRSVSSEWSHLREAIHDVCRDLARMIPADGEGATRLIEVVVEGATSIEDARHAARQVASSNLVKSAVHGGDPNWGRVVAALGQARIPLDTSQVSVTFEGDGHSVCVLEGGTPRGPEALEQAALAMAGKTVRIRIGIGQGRSRAEAWGCDLTEEYVRFNSAYST